ncbi:MAG: hypothetical protein ACRDFX_06050 [Chloroflexota bacterium]
MKVFVQTEGHRDQMLIEVDDSSSVQDLVVATGRRVPDLEIDDILVSLEDRDGVLEADIRVIDVEVNANPRVHLHHCRHITVTINYQAQSVEHRFPPSTRIARVKDFVIGLPQFNIDPALAPELVLALCEAPDDRPDDDVHIGSLVTRQECKLCLNLGPSNRPQG